MLLQFRRHLDAGQVGVSMVRRVGSGVSLHPTRPHRSRTLRERISFYPDAAREWYMHPNGQIPGLRVGITATSIRRFTPGPHCGFTRSRKKHKGVRRSENSSARVFQKLLLNFTWWVNRKDSEGMNVFEGGFLGLDKIGVFDRSRPLPTGGTAGPGRWDELDGDVLPEYARDRS